MLRSAKFGRCVALSRRYLEKIPFWVFLFLVFFRSASPSSGTLLDYFQHQVDPRPIWLSHFLRTMDSLAHTAPIIDFFVSFRRLGILFVIALAAKWILISYAIVYVVLSTAESVIQRKASAEIPGALAPRSNATAWIINVVIFYFLFVTFTWGAKIETCASNGGVMLTCSATVPSVLCLCALIAAAVDLLRASIVRHPYPVTRLFSVFD